MSSAARTAVGETGVQDDLTRRRRRARARGVTALMYAAQQGDVDRVRRIIRAQSASLFDRDRTGKSALHYCCTSDSIRSSHAADLLVMAAPDLVEARDEDGFTPLHLAVIAGNLQLVTFLLANNADVNAVDNEKHTVVHWATVCGETAALRAVMAAGAPVSTPDVHGGYPLHYAAQMCGGITNDRDSTLGTHVLHTLLSHKNISVSVTDNDQRQPLLWAASAGSARAVLALVRAGAAVESADKDGLTALHCAASRGHTDCLDTLLTLCGASPDVIDSNGCTALHYAVTLGHADATALLLAHGADPNRQDRKGRSPAHCGCAKGQFETVKLLGAQHGANLWLRNARGDLPLHEAAAAGRRELVQWLLGMRPSQVNARNNDGRCPLHMAALNDNADMCKILLDSGAQVNPVLRTSRNVFMTPLDCALQRGFRSTAKFLQLHGGVPASRLAELRNQPASAMNLQIRDDVTFSGETSSDSEKEQGNVGRISKKFYKKVPHKLEKANMSLTGSEEEVEKLESSKLGSTQRTKKRSSDRNKEEKSSAKIDNSTPPVSSKRTSSKNLSSNRLEYTNEIIINGKTEINIHQTREIIVDKEPILIDKVTETVDPSEAGLPRSASSVRDRRPRSAKFSKGKDRSGRTSAGKESAKSRNITSPETIMQQDKASRQPSLKTQSTNTSEDTAETVIENKIFQPTMATAESGFLKEDSKKLLDQQSLMSNTSEDVEEHKDFVVEASVHEPPKSHLEHQKEEEQRLVDKDSAVTTEGNRDGTKSSEEPNDQIDTSAKEQDHGKDSEAKAEVTDTTVAKKDIDSERTTEDKKTEEITDAVSPKTDTVENAQQQPDVEGKEQKSDEVTESEILATKEDTDKAKIKGTSDLEADGEVVKTTEEVSVDTSSQEKQTGRELQGLNQDVKQIGDAGELDNIDSKIRKKNEETSEEKLQSASESIVDQIAHEIENNDESKHDESTNKDIGEETGAGDTNLKKDETVEKEDQTVEKQDGDSPGKEVASKQDDLDETDKSKAKVVSDNVESKAQPRETFKMKESEQVQSVIAKQISNEKEITKIGATKQKEIKKKQGTETSNEKHKIKDTVAKRKKHIKVEKSKGPKGKQEDYSDEQYSSPSEDVSLSTTNQTAHKSFRVLDGEEVERVNKNKTRKSKRSPKKESRSRSEENKHKGGSKEREKLKRSKIPTPLGRTTLSKSDRHLDKTHLSEKRALQGVLDGRVPSLPNIYQDKGRLKEPPRSESNMSAPLLASLYSDNESMSDAEADSRSLVARQKKRVKKRPKTREARSAGSGYESSNLIDSGFEPSPRSTRIPKWKNMSERGVNMSSVTQNIQSNIRRYHLERKIFQQLLELKRHQIRAGQHNEAVLVKRAIDAYHQSCASTVGAGRYIPEDFSFKSFEKFLYESLRKLQKTDVEYMKGLPEAPTNPLLCTRSTNRCMHATHAYTGVPCAAYLPRVDHHTIPKIGYNDANCKPGTGFLPNINSKKAVTLELSHGTDKQVISLPTDRLDHNKRYYVTFTVKGHDQSSSNGEDGQNNSNAHMHSKSD